MCLINDFDSNKIAFGGMIQSSESIFTDVFVIAWFKHHNSPCGEISYSQAGLHHVNAGSWRCLLFANQGLAL